MPAGTQSTPQSDQSLWPLTARLRWLRAFRTLLASHADTLCQLISADVHKPIYEAHTGEIMPVLAACNWHLKHAPRLLAPRKLPGRVLWQLGTHAHQHRAPLGTVAIIATWNYPVQLLAIQLIQALVAGNRVIVKPSENSPRSQLALLRIAQAAGLPDGYLRHTPATRAAGQELLDTEPFDHLVFTGSTRVGKQLAAWAAERLITTTLELSGRDSAFVLPGADAALAASTIWHSVVMNAGQTCMAPRRALVDRAIYPLFIAALSMPASGARPVRLISDHAAAHAYRLALDAHQRGARTISGTLEAPRGPFLTPLALLNCPADCALTGGDHFAPVLAVVPVDNIDHALSIHNACDQHLATSIFGPTHAARQLASRLNSSVITINDAILPQSHPAVALGGAASSGWGRSASASRSAIPAQSSSPCSSASPANSSAPKTPPRSPRSTSAIFKAPRRHPSTRRLTLSHHLTSAFPLRMSANRASA
jgi:acyl-CoA reductase-like NAD-dependent aldehyde dehydrogenase